MSTATLAMVMPAPEERERTAQVVRFFDAHRSHLTAARTPAPTPDFSVPCPSGSQLRR